MPRDDKSRLHQIFAQEQQIRRHAEADAARSRSEARPLKERPRALERRYDVIVTSHDALAMRLMAFEDESEVRRATDFGGTGEAPSPPPQGGPPVAASFSFPPCKECGRVGGHTADCPIGRRGTRVDEEVSFDFDGLFDGSVTVEDQQAGDCICMECGVAGRHTADCPAHERVGGPVHTEEVQSEAQQRKGGGLGVERAVGADSVHGGAQRGPSADALLLRLKALVNVAAGSTDGDVRAELDRFARVVEGATNSNAVGDLLIRLREGQALEALGEHPDPDTVNEVANQDLTSLYCDECGEVADAVVEVGQEPDYESRTALLCGRCVRAAAVMLKANMTTALEAERADLVKG